MDFLDFLRQLIASVFGVSTAVPGQPQEPGPDIPMPAPTPPPIGPDIAPVTRGPLPVPPDVPMLPSRVTGPDIPMPSPTPLPVGPDVAPGTEQRDIPFAESPKDRLGVWRKYLQDTGGGTQETFAEWLKKRQDEPPEGYVRLWRVGPLPGEAQRDPTIPDWVQGSPEFQGTLDASGRWFTSDPAIADWYMREHPSGAKSYIDVPADEAESYRVANLPPEHPARSWSANPTNEFFLPREVAQSAQRPTEEPAPIGTPAPGATTVEQGQRLVKVYIESRIADSEQRAEDPQLSQDIRARHRALADTYRQRLPWAEFGVRGPEDLPPLGPGERMVDWLRTAVDRIDDAMGTGGQLAGQ